MIPREKMLELCNQIDGEFSLYVSVPSQNEYFAVNENQAYYSASTIKVPLLCLLFQDAEQGRIDLSEKVIVRAENRCGGSGVLQSLNPELEITIFDLAELMIIVSDNIATNELIDRVGMARLEQFCKENGFKNTWLWGKMMAKAYHWPEHLSKDLPINSTCAGDMGRLMERIAAGTIVGEQACKKMLQILVGQQKGRLRTQLPCMKQANPYADHLRMPPEGKVLAATKGGTKESMGAVHDAGIFFLPDGGYYIMSVFTKTEKSEETSRILTELGRVMYEAMCQDR